MGSGRSGSGIPTAQLIALSAEWRIFLVRPCASSLNLFSAVVCSPREKSCRCGAVLGSCTQIPADRVEYTLPVRDACPFSGLNDPGATRDSMKTVFSVQTLFLELFHLRLVCEGSPSAMGLVSYSGIHTAREFPFTQGQKVPAVEATFVS